MKSYTKNMLLRCIAILVLSLTLFSCESGKTDDPGLTSKEVSNLKGTGNNSSIALTWNNPSYEGFDYLSISWIKKGSTGTPETDFASANDAETYTITGLASGTTYVVTVKTSDTTDTFSSGVSIEVATTGTPTEYTQLFYDDFERANSASLGNNWFEIENQGILPNSVMLVSGKAVMTGGYTENHGNTNGSCIVPQMSYSFSSLETNDWRITTELDLTQSDTINLWLHLDFSQQGNGTTYIGRYTCFVEESSGSLTLRIRDNAVLDNGVSNNSTFTYQSTDALSVTVTRSGNTITETLVNNTTGASKTLSAELNTTTRTYSFDQITLCGGNYDRGYSNSYGKQLRAAINSFKIEKKN